MMISSYKNLLALAVIQGGNALIPLILYPYYLSKVGATVFAKFAITEALVFILLTISLYSFDVVGIRDLRKQELQQEESISKLYYGILYARILLLFSCMIPLSIIILFYDKSLILAFLIWMLYPIGVIMQSSYLYQAKKNNIPLAVFVSIPRIIALIAAVLFVTEESSLFELTAFVSVSYFLSGLASIFYLHGEINFSSPNNSKNDIAILLKRGKSLFFASLSVILYRGSGVLLLGAFGISSTTISAYALAEKYIKMLQAVNLPLAQLSSVEVVRELTQDQAKTKSISDVLWRWSKGQVLCSLLFILTILVLIDLYRPIFETFISNELAVLFFIMIPGSIFGILNYMYGALAYAALDREKEYARIILAVSVLAFLASVGLIYLFSGVGAAIAFVVAEALLFILLISKLKRAK